MAERTATPRHQAVASSAREGSAAADPHAAPLYRVTGLAVTFATERGPLHAVRGVDLEIHPGTVVGLVGESGSGKSVTAQALLRLLPPHAMVNAPRLLFRGEDVVTMRPAALQRLRGGRVGMIFQEPARSFDPIYSIEHSLAETLHTHRPELDPDALHSRSVALLEEVGIAEAERRLGSFPHQFSGGMLQRVMIAHALAADPEVLIADEPTTALDVTVQAQVVDLLLRLRAARGLAILFISHDLALVGQIADRLVVMYGGLVMEQGPAAAVLHAPRHPYTRALLDSHLPLGVHYTEQPLHAIPGNVPDPLHPEPGCPFAPRCAVAEARCARAIPPLVSELADATAAGTASFPVGADPHERQRPDTGPPRTAGTIHYRCVLPGAKASAVTPAPTEDVPC
ncbi:MAG: ABC transporter ATP-binding protein [Spirochaetaceae bacterium]|nr:ABC transporter ATP-binding protein [Spirochaetaceae bacterium]